MPKTIIELLNTSIEKGVDAFISRIDEFGSYEDVKDIACYFKHPLMYLTLGKGKFAEKSLSYIKNQFLQADGDFLTNPHLQDKSENPAYNEFYTYVNGWITRAAIQSGYADIVKLSLPFLTNTFDKNSGGFYTHGDSDGVTDVITTSNLGLLHLESGNIDMAIKSGDYLCSTFHAQPKINEKFYLRSDKDNKLIVEFSDESQVILCIDKQKPEQLYFMLAYPSAYLCLLYKETKDIKYFNMAKMYADFLLSCYSDVLLSVNSHKLAWALSIITTIDNSEIYVNAVNKIVENFLSLQSKSGLWFDDEPLKCYDQSAEILCWFGEIVKNLSCENKKTPTSPLSAELGLWNKQHPETNEKKKDELPLQMVPSIRK